MNNKRLFIGIFTVVFLAALAAFVFASLAGGCCVVSAKTATIEGTVIGQAGTTTPSVTVMASKGGTFEVLLSQGARVYAITGEEVPLNTVHKGEIVSVTGSSTPRQNVLSARTVHILDTGSKYELSAYDSGKTFSYNLTSQFTIILNSTAYPPQGMNVSCTPEHTIGAIVNVPPVVPPLYAARFAAVTPGKCVVTNGDVTVHIVVTPEE